MGNLEYFLLFIDFSFLSRRYCLYNRGVTGVLKGNPSGGLLDSRAESHRIDGFWDLFL